MVRLTLTILAAMPLACTVPDLGVEGRPCSAAAPCGPGATCAPASGRCVTARPDAALDRRSVDAAAADRSFPDARRDLVAGDARRLDARRSDLGPRPPDLKQLPDQKKIVDLRPPDASQPPLDSKKPPDTRPPDSMPPPDLLAPPDASGSKCVKAYGSAKGFALCQETSTMCVFHVEIVSCQSICGAACSSAAKVTVTKCVGSGTTSCSNPEKQLICTCKLP